MVDKSAKERIKHRKENAVDPEEFLLDIGAIEPTDGEENLKFTADFESRIERNIETYEDDGVGTAEIQRIFGVDDEDVEEMDRDWPSFKIIHTIRNWPSEGSVVFDAATDESMREVTDDWNEVPPRQRYRILQSLRSFQDECFFCSGEVVFSNNPVESCCSDRNVITFHCEGCDSRFLEFSAEPAGDTVAARMNP